MDVCVCGWVCVCVWMGVCGCVCPTADWTGGTHQGAGVGGVRRVVLEEAREPKVGHLAHQVAVDQDVAGGQVAVHVVHVRQVLHT